MKPCVQEPAAPLRYVACRLLYLQLFLSNHCILNPFLCATPPLFPSDIFSLIEIAALCDVVI